MPDRCPYCGGPVEESEVRVQYQTDIPERVPTKTTRFQIHVGRCQRCQRRVPGRHPRQTSDALGAAAHQIGPQTLALATHLNKQIGVSHGRLVLFFQTIFGLRLAKATLVRGIERLGQRAAPLYRQVQIVVRQSAVVYPDETSWRVNGRLWWLWDFVCASATLYLIRDSRGYDVLEQVLGATYPGVVVHDGWSPYDRLEGTTCLSNPENIRLANHLEAHQHQVFTYLWRPGVEASNWPAEQELRPAVVTRKMSAGNRTERGAQAQQVLMSVLRTCVRQGRDPVDLLVRLQQAATPQQRPRFRFRVSERNPFHDLPAP